MKYSLGVKILISFIVGGLAILYKIRINPMKNKSEVSTVVKVPSGFLFEYVTDPGNVPAYFSWISQFYEVDKRKNLTIEKSYRGMLDLPFFGQHEIRYYISDLDEGKWLVLRPDKVRGSYLKPEIILMISSISPSESQFYMKIIYHRTSALYQVTIGPWIKKLTDAQLLRVGQNVHQLGTAKWNMRQELGPTLSEGKSNSTKSTSRVVVKKRLDTSYWTNVELESKLEKKSHLNGIFRNW